jgi:hypothetical protein
MTSVYFLIQGDWVAFMLRPKSRRYQPQGLGEPRPSADWIAATAAATAKAAAATATANAARRPPPAARR